MSLMRSADGTMHFNSNHAVTGIAMLAEGALIDWTSKARPAGSGSQIYLHCKIAACHSQCSDKVQFVYYCYRGSQRAAQCPVFGSLHTEALLVALSILHLFELPGTPRSQGLHEKAVRKQRHRQ